MTKIRQHSVMDLYQPVREYLELWAEVHRDNEQAKNGGTGLPRSSIMYRATQPRPDSFGPHVESECGPVECMEVIVTLMPPIFKNVIIDTFQKGMLNEDLANKMGIGQTAMKRIRNEAYSWILALMTQRYNHIFNIETGHSKLQQQLLNYHDKKE